MKISKRARRDAKQLFRECVVKGQLDEPRVRQVAQSLAQSKPRGYLGILSHFHRLVKLEIERRTARVESAVEVSADFQASVRGSLAKAYGPGLEVLFTRKASLLGGMRIKVGSDVYDGSVEARLAALQESF